MFNERSSQASNRFTLKEKRVTVNQNSSAYTAATSNKSFDVSSSQIIKVTPSMKPDSTRSRHRAQLSLIDIKSSGNPFTVLRANTNLKVD